MASHSGMVAHPTLDEFIQHVTNNCNVTREQETVEAELIIIGPEGEERMRETKQIRIEYLLRDLDGHEDSLTAPLQDIDPKLALEDDVLRGLCQKLHVPLSDFDLSLEDLEKFNFGTY